MDTSLQYQSVLYVVMTILALGTGAQAACTTDILTQPYPETSSWTLLSMDLTGRTSLMFSLQDCNTFLIGLSETETPTLVREAVFGGYSNSKSMIRECYSGGPTDCSSSLSVEEPYTPFNCPTTTVVQLWLAWTPTTLTYGTGLAVGSDQRLTLDFGSTFSPKFLHIASLREAGTITIHEECTVTTEAPTTTPISTTETTPTAEPTTEPTMSKQTATQTAAKTTTQAATQTTADCTKDTLTVSYPESSSWTLLSVDLTGRTSLMFSLEDCNTFLLGLSETDTPTLVREAVFGGYSNSKSMIRECYSGGPTDCSSSLSVEEPYTPFNCPTTTVVQLWLAWTPTTLTYGTGVAVGFDQRLTLDFGSTFSPKFLHIASLRETGTITIYDHCTPTTYAPTTTLLITTQITTTAEPATQPNTTQPTTQTNTEAKAQTTTQVVTETTTDEHCNETEEALTTSRKVTTEVTTTKEPTSKPTTAKSEPSTPAAATETKADRTEMSVDTSTSTTFQTSTPRATTSKSVTSAPKSTPAPIPIKASREQRGCRCLWQAAEESTQTAEEQEREKREKTAAIVRELTVPTTNMSATVRRKTSAPDRRPSATTVGSLGAVLCFLPVIFLLLLDLISVCARRLNKQDGDYTNQYS